MKLNRDSYNRVAAEWDRARTSFVRRERDYLDAMLDGLPPASSILDLGCGTGRPMAEYILARGHRVTGVDQSANQLAFARERFPTATWIESTIEDFVPTENHAAVLCWDALFHIDRSAHERIVTRIAAHLSPGGRFMVTVGGSEHPAFTDTMFGEEFFYDSHPPERFLDLLRDVGLEPTIAEFMNVPTDGRDKGRFAVVARRVLPASHV